VNKNISFLLFRFLNLSFFADNYFWNFLKLFCSNFLTNFFGYLTCWWRDFLFDRALERAIAYLNFWPKNKLTLFPPSSLKPYNSFTADSVVNFPTSCPYGFSFFGNLCFGLCMSDLFILPSACLQVTIFKTSYNLLLI